MFNSISCKTSIYFNSLPQNMAPLLIDSRDLLKLGFTAVLGTTMVFAGGFFMGHQRAAAFYQAGSDIQPLSLPVQVAVTDNIADSQLPSIIEAGEDMDVDQPENMTHANSTVNDSASGSVELSSSARAKSYAMVRAAVLQQPDHNETHPVNEKQASVSVQATVVTGKNDNGGMVKNTLESKDASITATFTSADLNKIKYSVQVGMYGRLANAENMVTMLKSQRYDAYVSDYSNKNNKTRYNVRFGYFTDKKSAIAMLKKFKADQSGDGYLVKFSAKNIVNIAGATEIKQIADVPEVEHHIDKTSTPVVAPSDAVQEVSQVDILTNTLITAN